MVAPSALAMRARAVVAPRRSHSIGGRDPREQVIFEIPQWDFGWQGRYQYAIPMRVVEGDTILIRCTWSKGAGKAQRYTVWGEGAQDEMRLSSLTVLPDDPKAVPSRRSGLSLGFRERLLD